MKKIILCTVAIAAISLVSCKNEVKTEAEAVQAEDVKEIAMTNISFGVRGNCGMCETTIEKAATSVDGVINAAWDVDKKKIDVSFDETKTNAMTIHSAIANSGYDTDKVAANEDAYNNLAECCQYDHEMAMNQTGEVEADDHDH